MEFNANLEEVKKRLEEAKKLYENAKAMKKEQCYTLRDITDEDFVLREKRDKSKTEDAIDSKKNWYIQRFKQFKEMMNAFDVLKEFESIKPKGEYSFSERNKTFILMLFREYGTREYSGKFEHLKRGDVYKTDGAYLMEVYTGILDIFYDANASESLIEAVQLKLWNRLNIPQRNIDAVLESVYDVCRRMVKKNVDAVSGGMGVREKIFWQIAFRDAFYDFIRRWDQLYENMEEIRKEEVLKKAELEAASASPEWEECVEIEFSLSSEICSAYHNDLELQQLNAERDKLLGIGKKRRPLIRDVEKPYDEYIRKFNKRMNEVKLDVIRKYIPEFNFPDGWDELPPTDFEFMPLNQLLETAMKDEQDQRVWFPILNRDELIKQMHKYFP